MTERQSYIDLTHFDGEFGDIRDLSFIQPSVQENDDTIPSARGLYEGLGGYDRTRSLSQSVAISGIRRPKPSRSLTALEWHHAHKQRRSELDGTLQKNVETDASSNVTTALSMPSRLPAHPQGGHHA